MHPTTASSSRQTQSFLIQRFAEAGIHLETRHGQNFLIDLNLLDLLVRSARLEPHDVVLEVGTGLGSLTSRMAPLVAAVITVEIDPRLFAMAGEELASFANVTMLRQDALKNKNTIHPAVLDAVREQVAAHPGGQFKLVSNLPYNIATPILSNLLTADPLPVSLTATIQKELADRIVARPGTKDYSALSIWMQAMCAVEIVREMGPQVFWPRPKVNSAIIHVVLNPAKRALVGDVKFFHDFVRGLFLHRRKFLRGVLIGQFREQLDKATIDDILAPFELPTDSRAEQLEVQTLIALAEAVRQRLPAG
jgi:16S rRNA (adenine1518-N6/adenine1519-N6)-dimethyltransferase